MTLELIAPDGLTVVATGTPELVPGVNAENVSLAILDFSIAQSGSYTVRVGAEGDTEYHLFVTDESIVDLEPNNSLTDPIRSLNAVTGAHGYVALANGPFSASDPVGDATGADASLPDIASIRGEIVGNGLHLIRCISAKHPGRERLVLVYRIGSRSRFCHWKAVLTEHHRTAWSARRGVGCRTADLD